MPEITSERQFSIAADHIDLMHGGKLIRVHDQSVQGVSTRVLGGKDWTEFSHGRRTCNIEFLDSSGVIVNVTIEASIRSNRSLVEIMNDTISANERVNERVNEQVNERVNERVNKPADELADYARRVAVHASRNVLNELVEKHSVERNGFTINDQGVLLTASGDTLCCGLFDMTAIDVVEGRTIIWTDCTTPAAVLKVDGDSNALTLAHVLPQLIHEVHESDDSRLVGFFDCKSGVNFSAPALIAIVVVSLVAGTGIAWIRNFIAAGTLLNQVLVFMPVTLPILIAFGMIAYKLSAGVSRIAVFRTGICIREGKQSWDFHWDEMQSISFSEKDVQAGKPGSGKFVTFFTLRFYTKKQSPFGSAIKLVWPKYDSCDNCVDYLKHQTQRYLDRNVQPVVEEPIPELESQIPASAQ